MKLINLTGPLFKFRFSWIDILIMGVVVSLNLSMLQIIAVALPWAILDLTIGNTIRKNHENIQ